MAESARAIGRVSQRPWCYRRGKATSASEYLRPRSTVRHSFHGPGPIAGVFTGIVEETGEVTAVEDGPEGRRIGVSASFCDELEHGQSVSISGACLTVEGVRADDSGDGEFELFCSEETLERTYLDDVGGQLRGQREAEHPVAVGLATLPRRALPFGEDAIGLAALPR